MSSEARIPPPPVLEKTFVLEFWFEWSQLEASHWRGKVLDQQRDPRGFCRPVATPEDAFELVRHALAQATPAAFAVSSHIGRDSVGEAVDSNSCLLKRLARILHAMFRKGT